MPAPARSGASSGAARCEGKGGALLEKAMARSMRAGGSASVVDPLLSLLLDLRRLQDQVLDTLSLLGVDVAALPAPYQSARRETPPPDVDAVPSSPGPSPSAAPASNALTTYITRAAALAPSPGSTSPLPAWEMVDGVLHWLDDHFREPAASEAAPSPSSDPAATLDGPSARRLLAEWVACSASGSGTPVLVQDGDVDDSAIDAEPVLTGSGHSSRKRRRREPAVVSARVSPEESPMPAPSGKTCAGVRSQGSYTSAELAQLVQSWSHYRRGLTIASREAGCLLHALCAPHIGGSLSTHAKWIEVTAKDKKRPFQLPSCASLTTNYEEILSCHDCFATCQRPVHAALLSLEACVERLCDEALVVGARDSQFWDHVRCFQSEYAALHTIRAHVARLIESVRPCLEKPM